MGRSPLVHTRFHVPRITPDTIMLTYLSYTGLSPSMVCFPKTILLGLLINYIVHNPKCITTPGLGSSYFARHYSRNRFFFLFLQVLRCFSSLRSLLIRYFTYVWIISFFLLIEFPHSDIYGSMDICSLPQLFAAYHVLLRLLVPRHSPYALSSLTYFLSLQIVSLFLTTAYIFYPIDLNQQYQFSSLPLLFSLFYIFFNVLR